jgi:hypothetical protein
MPANSAGLVVAQRVSTRKLRPMAIGMRQTPLRQQILAALGNGHVLKPLDPLGFPGQWGCLPIPKEGPLIGCDEREVTGLANEGLIERLPNVGYVLARNPPSAVRQNVLAVAPQRQPVPSISFSALLNRDADLKELSTVFHLHIPRTAGTTVQRLLRQNNFTTLDFDMGGQSFFGTVIEEIWSNVLLTPAPRQRFAFTGHFPPRYRPSARGMDPSCRHYDIARSNPALALPLQFLPRRLRQSAPS